MLCHLKKLSIKQGLKTQYFIILTKYTERITIARVAMTTTYSSTSCNSETLVACMLLVSGEGLLHACIFSIYIN